MARPRYASPTAGAVTAHALRLGLAPSEDPRADAAELVAKAVGDPEPLRAACRRILGSPGSVTVAELDPVRATALELLHEALAMAEDRPDALAG